jgi:hypothetical protein
MIAYRFGVTFEDVDGFYREFEMPVESTFSDFKVIILNNLDIQVKKTSFFMCDHAYRKKAPIFDSESNIPPDAEKPRLMANHQLNEFIDDPHQRMIFMIDDEWTCYIELNKIFRTLDSKKYPLVSKSNGNTPVELKPKPLPVQKSEEEIEEEEQNPENLINEDLDEDNEAYENEDMEKLDHSDSFFDGSFQQDNDLDDDKS